MLIKINLRMLWFGRDTVTSKQDATPSPKLVKKVRPTIWIDIKLISSYQMWYWKVRSEEQRGPR